MIGKEGKIILKKDREVKKLEILERAEANLNDQIEKYYDGTDEFSVIKRKGENFGKGTRLTKSLLLECSMCDEVEDIKMAEQVTSYINYIFNKDNNGFSILYTWFKDALIEKNGIVFPKHC